ncbi:MAG: type II toxin-antitoxin system Phd/YefM family antitoxin [Providencia rettgeri]|jgi:antitoxin YefM|nr:antitoxin YefM [Eubacteriaceae bacterium]MDK2936759.1 antitoxin YefM [Eubacteriaceae bacterium]
MLAINYTTMRNKMKDYFDRVTDDCETVIVTRKGEKNVVLISLDEYNNLMENNFITGNKAYYDRLLKSKSQLEQGQVNELDESALNDE